MRILTIGLIAMVIAFSSIDVFGQTTFFGPTPYLSTADIPIGLHPGNTPAFLEDFEDGSLDGGITSNPPITLGSLFGLTAIDGVDADDGLINGLNNDGAGNFGESFWASSTVTFTFPSPVVSAGLVWTDGSQGVGKTLEAFGPGMVSLGTHGPFTGFEDGNFLGGTAEDRFFGVSDPSGIVAIRLFSSAPLEIDHLQIGPLVGATPVPTLSQWALIILGLTILCIGAIMIVRKREAFATT